MNRKIISILMLIILFLTLFSGCTEEKSFSDDNSNIQNNLPPVGSISALEEAYFGETIVFDASKSFDPDGIIVSYNWDFGDNETAEGVTVNHIYRFENNFAIDYPLIYSVFLFVKDDSESITATSFLVKVFPSEYIFYLDGQKLITGKPSSSFDKIKGRGLLKLRTPQTLSYNLENSITVQKCKWNATIYLEKSLLAIVNKLSIIFYDKGSNIIVECEEKLGLSLWKEKTVEIFGIFENVVEFKSIKIAVYGFSIGEKISILYGGEKASNLLFDFTS